MKNNKKFWSRFWLLWSLMPYEEFGSKPRILDNYEDEDDECVEVFTYSMSPLSPKFINGKGKTIEEAFQKFEVNLDEHLLGMDRWDYDGELGWKAR